MSSWVLRTDKLATPMWFGGLVEAPLMPLICLAQTVFQAMPFDTKAAAEQAIKDFGPDWTISEMSDVAASPDLKGGEVPNDN